MGLINPRILDDFVRRVRMFIRDDIHLNKLLGNRYESDPKQVRQAVVDALFDWNTSDPPIQPVSLADHPAKHLLIRKASIELLKSAGIWHSREHMPSSDGGTSADDHAKIAEYAQWMQMIEGDYERKKTDLKVSINVSQCYGGLSSEYNYEYFEYEYGEWGDNKVANTDIGGSGGDPYSPPGEDGNTPPVPDGGTAPSEGAISELSYSFDFSDLGAATQILTVLANHVVIEARVIVQSVFLPSGSAPYITVGDADDSTRHVNPVEADLSEVGTYIANSGHQYLEDTPIIAQIFNAPISGTGIIVIRFDGIDN